MNNKSINTLQELQAAKAQLRQEMKISRHELFRSLETTRLQAKDYFWKGLALPAGLLGLGAVGMRVARNSFHNQAEKIAQSFGLGEAKPTKDSTSPKWYMQFLPIAINLVQMFLANRQHNSYQSADEVENDDESYQAAPAYENVGSRMR